jgi:GAF domain-containing protein
MKMEQVQSQYRGDLCLRCGEISCTLNFDEALEAIMKAAHQCLTIDASSILLLDPPQTSFSIAAVRNLSQDYVGRVTMPVDDGPGRTLLRDQVVSVEDLSEEPSYREIARTEGLRSALAAPLKSRQRTVGALWVFTREPHTFTVEETSYLATIAAQGGVTLGNARLHRNLHVIAEIGRAVTSRLRLEEILQVLVEKGAAIFGARGAAVYLTRPEENTLEVKSFYGVGDGFFANKVLPIDEEIRPCLERLVIISDVPEGGVTGFPEDLTKEGLHSVVCTPLKIKDTSIGILRLYFDHIREFAHGDRVLFQILADFSAIAIENARLFNHIKRDFRDLTQDVWRWYDWGERPPKI